MTYDVTELENIIPVVNLGSDDRFDIWRVFVYQLWLLPEDWQEERFSFINVCTFLATSNAFFRESIYGQKITEKLICISGQNVS